MNAQPAPSVRQLQPGRGRELNLDRILEEQADREYLNDNDQIDDRTIYQLTEDVLDLLQTHLFDTRRSLELKVKTLSSEPERLSSKDVERLVAIICEYASKYRVLYQDQRERYQARQNYIQTRMRGNLTQRFQNNNQPQQNN